MGKSHLKFLLNFLALEHGGMRKGHEMLVNFLTSALEFTGYLTASRSVWAVNLHCRWAMIWMSAVKDEGKSYQGDYTLARHRCSTQEHSDPWSGFDHVLLASKS